MSRRALWIVFKNLDRARLPVAGGFMVVGLILAAYSLIRLIPIDWWICEGFSEARVGALAAWLALAFLGMDEARQDLEESFD